MLNTKQNPAIKKLYADILSKEILRRLLPDSQWLYTQTLKDLGTSFEVKRTHSVNSNVDYFEENHWFGAINQYGNYTKYIDDEIRIHDSLNNLTFTLEVNHSYPSISGLESETLDINELIQVDLKIHKTYLKEETYNYLKHFLQGKIAISNNVVGDYCFHFARGHITDKTFADKVIKKLISVIETYNQFKEKQYNKNIEILSQM